MGDQDFDRFEALKALYSIPLPEEVLLLWRFAKDQSPSAPCGILSHEAIAVRLAGPFQALSLSEGAAKPGRHRLDPPEFVVVAESTTDGYRWGYWYDSPDREPMVVGYDSEESPISGELHGASMTSALVRHLERTAERLEEDLQYDPDGADYYRGGLSAVSSARGALCGFASAHGIDLTARRDREVVAPTVDGLGIVALRESYAERLPIEELKRSVARNETQSLLTRAEGALKDGFPATSLQIGKAVFAAADSEARKAAGELMAKSYDAMSRGALAEITRELALEHG